MTRNELRERIDQEHAALLARLDGLPEARLSAPGPDGGWSLQDHMAHLADWQEYIAELIAGRSVLRGALSEDDMNRLNEATVLKARGEPLADTRARLERSRAALLAQVERLSDDDLGKAPHYNPTWDRTLERHIAGNSFGHYREHRDAIERLIG